MPMTESGRVADLRPPDLDDPAAFVARRDVPVLDVHDHESKGDVDESLLHLLARNTNARCARGDLVALTLGHTNADGPETEQPPFVGYARDFSVGTFRGEPCLLADFFFRAEDAATALSYPHRSIERIRSDDPAENYIDYVSLLRRPPERSLGLLIYARTLPAGATVVHYGRDLGPPDPPAVAADAAPSPDAAPPAQPPEVSMDPEQISALVSALLPGLIAGIAPMLAPPAAAEAPAAEAVAEPAPEDADAGRSRYDDDTPAASDEDDDDAERVQNEEASPGGDSTFIAGEIDGKKKKDDDEDAERVKMSRAVKSLRVENQVLRDQVDGQAVKLARLQYAREFDALKAEGVVFDPAKEMAAILDLPAKLRDGHVTRMREQYRRSPIGRRDAIETEAPESPESADAPSSDPAERRAVIDFATRHGITDIPAARARYRQEKAGRVAG